MCRICFSGEEDGAKGADRLFSPCQCRGSQGLVHVRCLNHWRARSRNNASYFTCNTCHYRYNLERATWAKRIEDPRLYTWISGQETPPAEFETPVLQMLRDFELAKA